MNWWIDSVVKAIRAVKADDVSLKLQNEFYEKSTHPLDTNHSRQLRFQSDFRPEIYTRNREGQPGPKSAFKARN